MYVSFHNSDFQTVCLYLSFLDISNFSFLDIRLFMAKWLFVFGIPVIYIVYVLFVIVLYIKRGYYQSSISFFSYVRLYKSLYIMYIINWWKGKKKKKIQLLIKFGNH